MNDKITFIDLWNLKSKNINKKKIPKKLFKLYNLRKEQLKYKFNTNNKTIINKYRNILNQPSNIINPETLVKKIKDNYKNNKNIKIIVKDIEDLKKENLNLILSVDKNTSKMLICEYIINNKKPIILVGKGVTYDTGGYIIKDKDSMNNMHLDKLGGCLCLYILEKLIKENTKKSVVVCIPLVENTISNNSTKPGDIIKSYSKLDVEISDTDAEGRLIIADALSYCIKNYKYRYIIDMGTFTEINNCYVSYTYFSLNNMLKNKLKKEARQYSENTDELKLLIEYLNLTKSTKADVINEATSCKYNDDVMICYFLLNFIPKNEYKKWLHINLPMITVNDDYSIMEGSESIYNFIKKL